MIKDVGSAYRRLFSTDDGQVVLEDLCNAHYINRSLYEHEEDREAIIAYREGGRNAILRILALSGVRLQSTDYGAHNGRIK